MKVSDHHVRSPLLDVAASCQTCHRVEEQELLDRAHLIQDRTVALIDRAASALVDLIDALAEAREAGANDEQLSSALALHRRAQWRLDFVFSENSHGFHASQEAARILAESIDFARQGEIAARRALASPEGDSQEAEREPVIGVTPPEAAPPAPRQPPEESSFPGEDGTGTY